MYPERAAYIQQRVSVDIYVSGYELLVRDTCFQATYVKSWCKLGIRGPELLL